MATKSSPKSAKPTFTTEGVWKALRPSVRTRLYEAVSVFRPLIIQSIFGKKIFWSCLLGASPVRDRRKTRLASVWAWVMPLAHNVFPAALLLLQVGPFEATVIGLNAV